MTTKEILTKVGRTVVACRADPPVHNGVSAPPGGGGGGGGGGLMEIHMLASRQALTVSEMSA